MSTTAVKSVEEKWAVTRNACKLCTPLGACMAFCGIEGCMTLLHGSQGCSTYIRRYMISHFREPIDIASSNFSENTAIYGGAENLKTSLDNVISQYTPEVVAIASTCLSETIGDDVTRIVKEYRESKGDNLQTELVEVSTPSYRGTHAEGFKDAIKAIVKTFASETPKEELLTLVPGMFSPADLRILKEILEEYGQDYVLACDYSDTLDGPLWGEYQKIPAGGTPVKELRRMGASKAVIDFTSYDKADSAAEYLKNEFGAESHIIDYPIGVEATDRLMSIISETSGKEMPEKYVKERGRLLDAMVDAHKHTFGVNALVYGETDLVVGLTAFLKEIGITPKIVATGGRTAKLKEIINDENIIVMDDADFETMKEVVRENDITLMVGNSKGYKMSREFEIPLVRVGFPIHDRVGAQRIQLVGYRGAAELFDKVINAIIQRKQDGSVVGYTYM